MSILQGKWEEELYSEFTTPYYKELFKACSVSKEGSPEPNSVFNTLTLVPLEKTQVAVIYDLCEEGHLQVKKLQHSGLDFCYALAGDMECQQFYANQNVLMYNISQYYTQGSVADYPPIGFYKFAHTVVKTLARQDENLVVLLLGNSIRKYASYFYNPKHLVLSAPLFSQTYLIQKSNQALLGSKVQTFGGQSILQRCNRFLIENKLEPIQWSREDKLCNHIAQN